LCRSRSLGFESADQPDSITVRAPDGQPLAVIDMPASDLAAARASWRSGVLAAEAQSWPLVSLLCGPLDWRRRLRSPPGHIVLTLLIAAMLVGARAIAWSALRLAGLDDPALAPRPLAEPLWLALASPLDFLFTTLAFGGVVALVTSSFEQWRQSRRIRVRVIPPPARSWWPSSCSCNSPPARWSARWSSATRNFCARASR
jgi:hypothetical protein